MLGRYEQLRESRMARHLGLIVSRNARPTGALNNETYISVPHTPLADCSSGTHRRSRCCPARPCDWRHSSHSPRRKIVRRNVLPMKDQKSCATEGTLQDRACRGLLTRRSPLDWKTPDEAGRDVQCEVTAPSLPIQQ